MRSEGNYKQLSIKSCVHKVDMKEIDKNRKSKKLYMKDVGELITESSKKSFSVDHMPTHGSQGLCSASSHKRKEPGNEVDAQIPGIRVL